jgi:hypothetical protein
MLDEIKTISVKYKEKKIELIPDFRAFKKLHKNTGNAFKIMSEFVEDTDKRVEHLPVLIQSMSEEDLTIEEIENNILGMQWSKVITMSEVVFNLINSEFVDPIAAEENSKNVEIPRTQEA